MLVYCKICGVEYDYCPHCAKVKSWRRHTDTLDHYYIWIALMSYKSNHDAKVAYDILQKRGIDSREVSGFTSDVQAILDEINEAIGVSAVTDA